jgi:hypothetical protein
MAVLCSSAVFAITPTPDNALNMSEIQAQKALLNTPGNPNPTILNVGGDTIGSAVNIASVPYSDSGNTCSFAHNYDQVCPWNAPGAADVVYKHTPAADISVNIDLCTSLFDTKVYVYDGGVGNLVACNDDAGCGTNGWRSFLECVALTAGHTYYIVVDGYSPTDCGTYYLDITECVPCVIDCPPGGLAEGEPDCHDNYYDTYNGGCNSVPPVFTTLECNDSSIVVCGRYGGFFYNGLSYRDTDWYQITLAAPTLITWCVAGETDTLVGIIQAPCPAINFYAYNFGSECTPICVTENLPAGTWYLWAGSLNFGADAGPCGLDYVATLDGWYCPVAVEPTSWSNVKNMYK